ncbi:ROK family protein [Thermovibrio ammonificans]
MKLGVDVGGTFIKLYNGKNREKVKTPRSAEELVELIAGRAEELSAKGVCIAVAGLVNGETGEVTESPNLPFLNGLNLKEEVEKRLTGTAVRVVNDATAAAYGEFKRGSGRGSRLFLCLTLGTGLGGGAVINGEPLIGVSGSAMEVGHTTVCVNGWPCHCGRRGCLEAYASSYGLKRLYYINTEEDLPPHAILELAKSGDEKALKAVKALAFYLGVGITNLVHTFNPDTVALAGGTVVQFPKLIKLVEEEVKRRAFKLPGKALKVVGAELGEFSGAVGAYELAP